MATHTPRFDERLEIASAVVMALSALMSSWASYQAALWDGEQAANYSRANALRIQASREATRADMRQVAELGEFQQWLNADARGDASLARFYRSRLPADLRPAFNAWMDQAPMRNPSAAPTPFVMPQYRPQERTRAAGLDRQADATFDRGQYDNAVSDAFVQSSTIMATALFFGGIGQVFKVRSARVGLLVIAVLALVVGAGRLLGLPLQILGFGPPTPG